jgi:hypothetical protein
MGLDVLAAYYPAETTGQRFELSFEVRNRLECSADCRCDLLKVRPCVGGRLKFLHFVPTFFLVPRLALSFI